MTVYANNVAGTLAATIGPSDTAILLSSGQGALFPNPGSDSYYATLVHITTGVIEIVQVTAKVVDTLTVVRGRDGTSGTSFTAGSVIELRLVAQMLRDLDWRTARNVANGLAPLDGGGLIPDANIPATITRDSELTAGLATKQNTLGFVPVQQGTGVNQGANTVKIGWGSGPYAGKTAITIDAVDQGAIAMEGWVIASKGVAGGLASLDGGAKIPTAQIPALSYLPLSGGNLTGGVTIGGGGGLNAGGTVQGNDLVSTSGYFTSGAVNAVLATSAAGTVYLRPNGSASATGQMTLDSAGSAVAVNFTATSDERLKHQIAPQTVRKNLADQIVFKRWAWRNNDRVDVGVIAQDLLQIAPEHVHVGPDDMYSVDYAKLALEAVIGLASRVCDVEAALSLNR